MNQSKKTLLLLAAIPVLLLLLISATGNWLSPHDPYQQQLSLALQPPNADYPLGTDRYGRCLLSRILSGAGISVWTALLLTLAAAFSGTASGLYCGFYYRQLPDKLLTQIINVMLAFPGLILALAITGFLGGGLFHAAAALLCTAWAPYARLVRRQVITIKSAPYIEAARLCGCTDKEIIFRYLLPAAIKPVILMAAANIGTMLLSLSALSFLGLGAQPPTAEWGAMLSSNRNLLQLAPWTVFAPGAALLLSVCSFNFLGNVLHDALEPDKNSLLKE